MSDDVVLAVIDALEALHVDYMLVGSLSSNFYGTPRSTEDADIVVHFRDISIGKLATQLGEQFQLDPQMSFEIITATTKNVLRHVATPFYVELFNLSTEPYDQLRFERRHRVILHGHGAFVASPEDVVVTKLRWLARERRPKDREDVKSVIAVQRANLDWNYIHSWCDQHGTRKLLDEILQTIPED